MQNIGTGKVVDRYVGCRLMYRVIMILFSGPNDHIFVYFTDHGASGLVAFPEDMVRVSELCENNVIGMCA